MRSLLEWLVRLYPREWRRRYGDEFSALLDDMPLRWGHVLDVARGAVVMQMKNPLVILTMGLIVGGLVGGASLAARAEVYESTADVLIHEFDFLETDRSGRPITVERALEPLSSRERRRVGIEVRHARPDGTPVTADQMVLRLTARAGSPEDALRLTQRLARSIEDVTTAAPASAKTAVLYGPSLPQRPVGPALPPALNILMIVNSASQGLLVGYVWLLIASRVRARRANAH